MGKEASTPSSLQLNSDKIELISAKFIWGYQAADNRCRVIYRVVNNDRTAMIQEIVFDVTETDFADLVDGFGGTMESRLETSVWQDIQSKFELVP